MSYVASLRHRYLLKYQELYLSEALPTITPHGHHGTESFADPCAGAPLAGDGASVSAGIAGLIEALKRSKRGTVPTEVLEAQDSLERRIRAHLPAGTVSVVLTDNRYTMISVRRIAPKGTKRARAAKRYEVRLHHMFADADPVIVRALAHYIAANDADASRVLGDFIDANTDHVRGRTRRAPAQVIYTAGEQHDLRQIFDELNAQYFENRIEAAITWGARLGRARRRNSIKMGSYSVEDRLIRIHRALDRPFVPRFFVAWIVFHEMLHQVHDIRVINGRREFHSKEFMADEAQFGEFPEAKRWERANIDALLMY